MRPVKIVYRASRSERAAPSLRSYAAHRGQDNNCSVDRATRSHPAWRDVSTTSAGAARPGGGRLRRYPSRPQTRARLDAGAIGRAGWSRAAPRRTLGTGRAGADANNTLLRDRGSGRQARGLRAPGSKTCPGDETAHAPLAPWRQIIGGTCAQHLEEWRCRPGDKLGSFRGHPRLALDPLPSIAC